ncbi:hypothetical protein PIB30_045555 [Stylosanthes scabra]|uniref:Uncharacterized protein n=1 Tax=Stylosanthes scabra TaxID=79078 RepID=A0ABU6VF72_9FABA|nr:hypothetical protein [Stylosanthes scabra]
MLENLGDVNVFTCQEKKQGGDPKSEFISEQPEKLCMMPSDGHNFHTGAPIDASFVATRSFLYPIRFYPTIEGQGSPPMQLNEGRNKKGDSKLEDALGTIGMRVGAWMLKWSGRTAYACFELGIQVRFRTR